MSSDRIHLSVDDARALGEGALRGIGYEAEEAWIICDHVIDAALIEHQREPIEVLDPSLELAAVHHPDRDGELFAAYVVEEDVLDVGLGRFRFRRGGH